MTGLKINGLHTKRDLNLDLLNCTITSPEPVTITQKVPGWDGVLDLSRFFGEIKYKNRELHAEFDFQETDSFVAQKKKERIINLLHGSAGKIILDADPDYYYKTDLIRVKVEDINFVFYKIILDASLHPFKFKNSITERTINVKGQAFISFTGLKRAVVPGIFVDQQVQLELSGRNFSVQPGVVLYPDFILKPWTENRILCKGNGKITIKFQERCL